MTVDQCKSGAAILHRLRASASLAARDQRNTLMRKWLERLGKAADETIALWTENPMNWRSIHGCIYRMDGVVTLIFMRDVKLGRHMTDLFWLFQCIVNGVSA